jgi:pimeloyl-CoA synthetase
MTKIALAFLIAALPISAGDNKVPESVREFAKKKVDADPLMTDQVPADIEKITMSGDVEESKGAMIYNMAHTGYRISCQIIVSVKKNSMKAEKLRCWNHFGDDSNPMP